MRTQEALEGEFPGLRVLELELEGLTVERSRPALEALKERVATETRARRPTLEAVKDEPIFRAYRDFFWPTFDK